MDENKRIIGFDGGPNTGKTSVLEELRKKGYGISEEAARPLIEAELAEKEQNPHYESPMETNPLEFQYHILDVTLQNMFEVAKHHDLILADRWIPAQLHYFEEFEEALMPHFTEMLSKHPVERVFILDELGEENYQQGGARREDYPTSLKIHQGIINAYVRAGCEIRYVKKYAGTVEESIEQRVAFILKNLKPVDPDDELEQKYRVHDLKQFRKNLKKNYLVVNKYTGPESTWVQPTDFGYERRRIQGNSVEKTVKHKTEDPKRRKELNYETTFAEAMDWKSRPGRIHIESFTDEYRLAGNKHALISFDNVKGLGRFVEIEAASHRHLEQIEDALGLGKAERIDKSYWQMVQNS